MDNAKIDTVFVNGKITTLDKNRPDVSALAICGDRIAQIGDDQEIMRLKKPNTKVIDLHRRRMVPGLIDSHIHMIRGGLSYNMELRWDGVASLSEAMRMLRKQADQTPPPQWVRVVGGFSERQFYEKRLPTLAELNQIVPDTPVLILHLYDRALLNRAAVDACGFSKETPDPPGGKFERDRAGNPTGLLLANPNATILYSTLAKGPKLPREYQLNSTRQFMRELNRLGLTGFIDAGGGFQSYPDDYDVFEELAREGKLTLRCAYNLFTQRPTGELDDFSKWTKGLKVGQGSNFYKLNGGGEMLVYSAADFEDFRVERPDMPSNMEGDLEKVVRVLAESHWPFRMHATYNETIERALNVFEKVNAEIPFGGIHWFFDHAETITKKNIERIKALGGGIAIQNRMAFQGEYFIDRYGAQAAECAPPIRAMLEAGVPVSAGTDATRVASYNPWLSLYWLVTGKTVGGLKLYPDANCMDREKALRLWTEGSTWFANDEGTRGQIVADRLADFIVLSEDYFSVADEKIKDLTSVLTVVGGNIVHADEEFRAMNPPLPEPMPDWSPVRTFGGYQRSSAHGSGHAAFHAHDRLDRSPGLAHRVGRRFPERAEDVDWAMGCPCWTW